MYYQIFGVSYLAALCIKEAKQSLHVRNGAYISSPQRANRKDYGNESIHVVRNEMCVAPKVTAVGASVCRER